jgi:hypothetical protein
MATWVSTMYSCTASFAGIEALPLLTSMVKVGPVAHGGTCLFVL